MEKLFVFSSAIIFMCGCRLLKMNDTLTGLLIMLSGAASILYWVYPTNGLMCPTLMLDCFCAFSAAFILFLYHNDQYRNNRIVYLICSAYILSWTLSFWKRGASPVQRCFHFIGHIFIIVFLCNLCDKIQKKRILDSKRR